MNIRLAFTLCGHLFYMFAEAQQIGIAGFVLQIEQNKELIAFPSYIESEKLLAKRESNLSDLQLKGCYLYIASKADLFNYSEFENVIENGKPQSNS